MKYRYIGKSGLRVSELGLGTMTFGTNASKKEAFMIMDKAYDSGINLFDSAELYPSPLSEGSPGVSEEWLGEWLKNKDRDSVVLATKVAGAANGWFVPPIRQGFTALDWHNISSAVEGSLRRLNTDYIDLYQTHWPDMLIPIDETLEALDRLVREGKVRYVGTSNDTCYGLTKANESSKACGLVRYQSIQNSFSLNNPRFLDELSTVCKNEHISLLAYSPLAGGVLNGKYKNNKYPTNARYHYHINYGDAREKRMAERFVNEKTLLTTEKFMIIASDLGVSPVSLAIAWVLSFDFVASALTSARDASQLIDTLNGVELTLDENVLQEIEKIQLDTMYPMG
jgi:aryl-alcohol dehydrogenase-like predicted oxidoreductase